MIHFLTLTIFAIGFATLSQQQNIQRFSWNLPIGMKVPAGLHLKYLTLGVGTTKYICKVPKGGKVGSWAYGGSTDSVLRDLSGSVNDAKTIPWKVFHSNLDADRFQKIGSVVMKDGIHPPTFTIDGVGSITAHPTHISKPSITTPEENIPWIQYHMLEQNGFATTVFRTSTSGGVVKGSCERTGEILL